MQLNTPTPPNSPNSSVSNGPPADAGKLIRAWRHRAGLTQEGLAHSLSVTFSTVSRWENGHVLPSRLAWRALQQLAAERGCPLVETDNGATVPANAAANGAHA